MENMVQKKGEEKEAAFPKALFCSTSVISTAH